MSEQIEQYREIIKNAPEGATHFGADRFYYKQDPNESLSWCSAWDAFSKVWLKTNQMQLSISLDHLRTIIAQHDRIAELERDKEQRDLEQQIKGIMRVMACRELNLSEGEIDTLILMKQQLRKGVSDGVSKRIKSLYKRFA